MVGQYPSVEHIRIGYKNSLGLAYLAALARWGISIITMNFYLERTLFKQGTGFGKLVMGQGLRWKKIEGTRIRVR
jgi:hypothetical protein